MIHRIASFGRETYTRVENPEDNASNEQPLGFSMRLKKSSERKRGAVCRCESAARESTARNSARPTPIFSRFPRAVH